MLPQDQQRVLAGVFACCTAREYDGAADISISPRDAGLVRQQAALLEFDICDTPRAKPRFAGRCRSTRGAERDECNFDRTRAKIS